jgi:hypothetical protein
MNFLRLKVFFNISAALFGNLRKYSYLCQMKYELKTWRYGKV